MSAMKTVYYTTHGSNALWLIRTIKVTRHVTQHHPGTRTPEQADDAQSQLQLTARALPLPCFSVAPSNVDRIGSWINHKVLSQQTRDGAVGPDGGYAGQRTSLCAHPLGVEGFQVPRAKPQHQYVADDVVTKVYGMAQHPAYLLDPDTKVEAVGMITPQSLVSAKPPHR